VRIVFDADATDESDDEDDGDELVVK